LWNATATPTNLEANDSGSVELGVRFSASTSGMVRAIRFYKSSANGGTHVGNLWSSGGELLATATFSGETDSGWQQANFTSPVSINANAIYVASYHTSVGRYSFDSGYFNTSHDGTPLSAPSSPSVGGNGVYAYSTGSVFPGNSFNATNYWVDVVFDAGAPDPNPPIVTSTTPAAGATDAGVSADLAVTFSKAMDPASLGSTTLLLRDASGGLVPVAVTYEASAFRAVVHPLVLLASAATYTATVAGGTTGPSARDIDGHPLAADYVWSFSTQPAPPPPPDEGPGGPILVISGSANPFSRYYVEILANEGFNSYFATDVSNLTTSLLQGYDVVVLGEMRLTTDQVAILGDWVAGGGNLIAMRPDRQLAGLLGLTYAGSILSEAYLLVDTSRAPGQGIASQTMQYHGSADRYVTSGATTVATLYSNATTATTSPAVTLRSVGANGGQAAAFAYDLAKSVVYTRQGNPAWAGMERDGAATVRPDDLFFPDYVDLDRVAIPQADEQQRLLANLIHQMQLPKRPLPRLWYLPGGRKAVIVHALDDHNTDSGTRDTFQKLAAQSPLGCSVADWQCLRGTSWAYTGITLTDTEAAGYESLGFELGVHVRLTADGSCSDWTPASLEAAFASDLQAFASTFTSVPPQRSNRTHCIAWSDWATQPKVELRHGIRYDMNYYYWPGSWVAGRPGFFTGSGMPMRFADLDGTRIDVYQGVSQLVNESGLLYPFAVAAMIDKAQGPEGYYGVFGTHDDYRDTSFSDGLIRTALDKGVAIVSAEQMLDWLDGRNASSIADIAFADGVLTFRVSADLRARNLVLMVPSRSVDRVVSSITRDGTNIPFTTQTIKGVPYALIAATTGSYIATFVAEPPPPPPPSGPFTLWPSSSTPSHASADDNNAVELGVRFSTEVDGFIKGIRFYKGDANTGPHAGALWSAGGELLATASFVSESAAGWQQVSFDTPVAITAGTVYVASYHTSVGRYSYDGNYFAMPHDNAPLHAVANASGGNGVYSYGAGSLFPSNSYNATNYWVDVVFDTQP
jgi:hypothetical protein